MATLAFAPLPMARDDRFFMKSAVAMAVVVVAGFSFQLAMGRSTFASPPLTHMHAVVFMGWVVIYLLQTSFATTGSMALHRRLGWVAMGWVAVMVGLGFAVTLSLVGRGVVPFFFTPLHFLVFDPLLLLTFAGLTVAAVINRRRTDWHRRLHFCAMALLMGPAFGRLMPMPFLIPFAWEATATASLIFPVIGAVADLRRRGRVHPAFVWGIGTMVALVPVADAIAYGPLGLPLYRAATAGTPGALVAPLAYPPRPVGPLRTGRRASI